MVQEYQESRKIKKSVHFSDKIQLVKKLILCYIFKWLKVVLLHVVEETTYVNF